MRSFNRGISASTVIVDCGKATLFVICVIVLLWSFAAKSSEQVESDWDITIGAGAIVAPEYVGGDEMEVSPVPLLDIEWRDRVFLSTRRGLGGYVINEERSPEKLFNVFSTYKFGGSVRYAFGREEDDSSNLDGLGDVDDTAEAGLFAEFGMGPLSLAGEIYGDVADGHEGLQGELGISYGVPLSESFFVSVGPVVKFGSDDFVQSFFGVDANQAASSAFTEYEANGGFYSLGMEATARYAIDDYWGVTALAGYNQLIGDAADSPIVEEEGAFTAGLFVSYTF